MSVSPIINIDELIAIYQNPDVMIFDASGGPNARMNYETRHLSGAFFVDVNAQLSDIKKDFKDGGRHPLPEIDTFTRTLSELGISHNTHVVIYDDNFGANAACRFWWMLRSLGHKKVQVLNGGLQFAIENNFPMESGFNRTTRTQMSYPSTQWNFPLSDIHEVERVAESPDYVVVDVRSRDRYEGKTEPIDLVAGHIPGAINIPLSVNTDEHGLFHSPEIIRSKYQDIYQNLESVHIIIHCGSGVSACQTILAIDYAQMPVPRLYVGSWSEWSRNGKKMCP